MTRHAILTAMALLALLLAAGCRNQGREAPAMRPGTPSAPAGDATAAPAPASVRSALPTGFPAAFPVPEGEVLGTVGGDVEEGASYTFAMRVERPPAEVLQWYRDELERAGYRVGAVLGDTTGGGGSVTFTRGGQAEQGLITVEDGGSSCRLSVTLTVER